MGSEKHYYGPDGGKHFGASLSVAKKDGLLASVNEQFGILAKPGLNVWLENELCKAAHELRPTNNEAVTDYTKRLKAARWKSNTAASLGTAIHEQIENCLRGVSIDKVPTDLRKYVDPAINYVNAKGFIIDHLEKVVVCMAHGFAGTADCIGKTKDGKKFVLDWKSKKTTPGRSAKPYDENRWQLSAYCVGHYGEEAVLNQEVWAVNCFISTTEVGPDGLARFESFSYKPDEVAKAWETAKLIFELYRKVTGHDPRNKAS